jgi:hypothetical protein
MIYHLITALISIIVSVTICMILIDRKEKKNSTVETFTESYTPNIEMNLGGGSLTAANVTGTTKVKAGNAELTNNNISFGTTTVLSPTYLRIGNTTIYEKHLRMLTGQQQIKIRNRKHYGNLDAGGKSGDSDSTGGMRKGRTAYIYKNDADEHTQNEFRSWWISPWPTNI